MPDQSARARAPRPEQQPPAEPPDGPPDPGREDQGPAREDGPGRPSPHTDDPERPHRPRETPLESAWSERGSDPPSQRPGDTHEDAATPVDRSRDGRAATRRKAS